MSLDVQYLSPAKKGDEAVVVGRPSKSTNQLFRSSTGDEVVWEASVLKRGGRLATVEVRDRARLHESARVWCVKVCTRVCGGESVCAGPCT